MPAGTWVYRRLNAVSRMTKLSAARRTPAPGAVLHWHEIRAARPVQVIREKFEHQIEQLYRFCDFRFRHRSDRSRSKVTREAYNRSRHPALFAPAAAYIPAFA